MGDFPYLEWLARRHVTKPEHEWRDHVKAHGLANYCLAVDEREDRRRLVYEIESSWYKGAHPLTFIEHQQLTNHHKQLLQQYREETQRTVDDLQEKTSKFDADRIFDDQNLQLIESFNSELIAASKACSDGLADVSKQLIDSSVQVLQKAGSQPPCKFAVLGLGSIAKGEATPYSDLEYAFLVERYDEYFTSLAIDSYFRLANLGESPLKTFDIADLKPDGEFLPLATAHKMKAGLRMDGITKNSGNIPTGNGKENDHSLTLTVKGLMDLYKTSAESPFDGMAGDKSDMLSATQVIYTNEGDDSHLHQDFLNARRNYEKEDHEGVCKKRLQSFQKDVEEYTFLPEFAEFKPPNNENVKLKADIFRYPTLLANNLKMCLGLDFCYAWEVYDWLKSKEMLSMEIHLYIRIVLCLSIFMRTGAYLRQKCQTDTVRVCSLESGFANKSDQVDFNIFVILGRLLIPLKQKLNGCIRHVLEISDSHTNTSIVAPGATFTSRPSSEHLSTRDVLRIRMEESFKSISVEKDDSLTMAEVIYFAGRYHQAKRLVIDKIGGCLDLETVDAFLQHLELDEQTVKKYKQLCGYLLYFTKDYATADEYFRYLIGSEPSHANFWKLLSAHCKQETGDLQSARLLLKESKASTEQSGDAVDDLLKSVYGANAVHQDISVSYSNMGTLLCYLSEFKESIQCHEKAVDLAVSVLGVETNHPDIAISYNEIGTACCGLSKYELAVEYHTKSAEMVKSLYGPDVNHPTMVISYNAIGKSCAYLSKYDMALDYLNMSLKMGEVVYGAESSNLVMAETYNNMGLVHSRLGKLNASLKYFIKSLEMKIVVYGTNSNTLELARSYNNVGVAHRRLGDFANAISYILKSLETQKAVYGIDAQHRDILIGLSNIGEIYQELGESKTALEYLSKASDMAKVVFGAEGSDYCIANINHHIGAVNRSLGKYSTAVKILSQALDMTKKVLGADGNHFKIAWINHDIGKTHHSLGDYTLALEHQVKSLEMLRATQVSHPIEADCLCHIGDIYCKLGKHALALESCTKSLDMRKALFGDETTNIFIAQSLDSIGSAHLGLGEYTTAFYHHVKALEMRKAIYGAHKNHVDIADSYNHVGDTYKSLHDHQLALDHYTKALDMGKAVYGAEANHPCIANSLYNIGETYRAMGEYTLSCDRLTKSQEMYHQLFGTETTHPDVVKCSTQLQSVRDKLKGKSRNPLFQLCCGKN